MSYLACQTEVTGCNVLASACATLVLALLVALVRSGRAQLHRQPLRDARDENNPVDDRAAIQPQEQGRCVASPCVALYHKRVWGVGIELIDLK